MNTSLLLSILSLILNQCISSTSLEITQTPPLLNVPTYSLATISPNGKTGMNILTYATPVSVKPHRIWAIGLFKGTVAHENFSQRREGTLQLLHKEHSSLVRLLGGESGRDVDKEEGCCILGFPWMDLKVEVDLDDVRKDAVSDEMSVCSETRGDTPLVLPGCAYYLRLSLQGDLIDCGSHDVAICRVDSMIVTEDEQIDDEDSSSLSYLNTARLRDLGIITEQGRVAK